jgi:uncharacterized protein (DUF488 family)
VDIYQVFSLGYQLRDLPEFVSILNEASVTTVVDVRQNAWSYKKGFSKKAFSNGLNEAGIEYEHASYVGNPKELRDNADTHRSCLFDYAEHLRENQSLLQQFANEFMLRVEEGKKICFVCYERHPMDCHRHIILDFRKHHLNAPIDVKHLAVEGAERFTDLETGEVTPPQYALS